MTREDLISALERATGPDRALDAAIEAETSGVKVWPVAGWDCPEVTASFEPDDWLCDWAGAIVAVPRYTGSVDAALTLVPEGWNWSANSLEVYKPKGRKTKHVRGAWARLESPDYHAVCWHAGGRDSIDVLKGAAHNATAATVPIALCIASLHAKAE